MKKKTTETAAVNRRDFLRNAATTAGAVALGASAGASPTDEPIRLPEGPASAVAWDEFQRELACVLPDLAQDEYLVLTRKKTNHYVQFMAQGRHGMRVEAVANEFLGPAARLSKQSVASLVAMGWHAPTCELGSKPNDEDEPADGSPNFYMDPAAPVPYAEVAAIAVRTLRDIYRVGHPGRLEYFAATSSDEPVSIRFPSLGIKRESGG